MTRAQLDEFLSIGAGKKDPMAGLDDREVEMVSMMSQGSNSDRICREMGLSVEDLADMKKLIQKKLGLKNDVQLIQFAAKQRSASF